VGPAGMKMQKNKRIREKVLAVGGEGIGMMDKQTKDKSRNQRG